MPTFEVEANGKRYEVEAPSVEAALKALGVDAPQPGAPAPKQQPAAPKSEASGQWFGLGDQLNTIGQGMTFGFGDELEGVSQGLHNVLYGKGSFGEGYQQGRDRVRGSVDAYREANPGKAMALEIGGAIPTALLPVGNLARGAGLLSKIGTGAKVGAAYGGLYGAGVAEGGPVDRATGALVGGGIGAVTGGAMEPVAWGLQRAGQGVASAFRSAFKPETEAARRIATARAADVRTGNRFLNPGDEAVAARTGQPIANIDRGGEYIHAVARSAADTSPEARNHLTSILEPRAAGQGIRVNDLIQRLVGGKSTVQNRAFWRDAARKANGEAYTTAYRAGDRPIRSETLDRLMGSPDVVQAMKRAAERGKTRAIADGYGGFNSGVKITDDGQVLFRRGANGQPTYPNLQFWDYTYRELRDSADAAFRAGRNSEGTAIKEVAKQMRAELDQLVPAFGEARSKAAMYFGVDDALEAGEAFAKSRGHNEETAAVIRGMNETERRMFMEGFADQIMRDIAELGDNRNVVISRYFNSPGARERINLALGRARANEIEAALRIEAVMQRSLGAVEGGPKTARFLADLGLAGGAGIYGVSTGDWQSAGALGITSILLRRGAGKVRGHINEDLARRVGKMLASSDEAVFKKGVQIVARNDAMLDALRRATIAPAVAAEREPRQAIQQTLQSSQPVGMPAP